LHIRADIRCGLRAFGTFYFSKEHLEYKWVSIKEAQTILCWDSNKTALWELEERIKLNDLIL